MTDQKYQDSKDLIYEELRLALATQRRQAESLETKASVLIGFAGAVLALLIGARQTLAGLDWSSKVPLLVGVILFVLSLAFLYRAYGVRKMYIVPDPLELPNYLSMPLEELRRMIIEERREAWRKNTPVIKRSARHLKVAFVIQSIGLLSVAIALLFVILFKAQAGP